jgi:hypothetical protein
MRTILRSCTAAVVLLLLAGCEATTFEHAPMAERNGCDPALVGDWFSLADARDGNNGEVELQVGSNCRLLVIEHKQDGAVNGEATQLHVGNDGRQGYAWVDAAWAFQRADSHETTVPGDVYVLRYGVHGERLELRTPDTKAIAHRIIDDDLQGETRKSGTVLVNRLTGTVTPQQLRWHGFFADKPARFERRKPPAEPAPAKRP